MSGVQIFFIALTFVAPVLLWAVRRGRLHFDRYDRAVCRSLAAALLGTLALEFYVKLFVERLPLGLALPMQLCDWALFASVAALWGRSRLGFELTYFWGLAGTLQALFTPALAHDTVFWQQVAFFFIHSGIVMAVLYLMLALGLRPTPRSLPRVLLISEVYVAAALLANRVPGANYGFLAHKPPQHSLLDLFAEEHWRYVAQINLTGWLFFAVLYLPWALRDLLVNPASRRPPQG